MAQNESLQALLNNARLICLVKFESVEPHLGTTNSAIKATESNLQKLFGHFPNPLLWTVPINCDRGKIAQLVLDIDSVDPTDLSKYGRLIQQFLNLLKDDVLKNALNRISQTSASTWNVRMLNALRVTLQEVENRKVFFKNDLDQDPDFPQMQARQQALVGDFRELLRTNAIESNESRVNNMKQRGTLIKQATPVAMFLKLFGKLSDFIDQQISGVSLIPVFKEAPSAENQAVLNALSVALTKVDSKVADLSTQGIDLSQNTQYQQLLSDQRTLQSSYRQALNTNSVSSTSADATAVAQLGDAIANASDETVFLAEYQKLNDLMRSKASATT